MTPETKQFIRENIELVDEENWTEFYRIAKSFFSVPENKGAMTWFLMQQGCDPMRGKHPLREVPTGYLAGTPIDHFIIPEGVEKIGLSAFYNTKLKSITIPESCRAIDLMAFSNCSVLHVVNIKCKYILDIGICAFLECPIAVVNYSGTKEEWIKCRPALELRCPTVNCSDGTLHYDPMGDLIS